jgi:ABC-type phosphate transport system ATPase subunit
VDPDKDAEPLTVPSTKTLQGMRQQVVITRTLAIRPEVLILDALFGALVAVTHDIDPLITGIRHSNQACNHSSAAQPRLQGANHET